MKKRPEEPVQYDEEELESVPPKYRALLNEETEQKIPRPNDWW